MIRALLAVSVPGFALGALGMALANRRAPPAVARARWLKIAVYCVIVHAVLVAAVLGERVLRGLLLAVLVCCGVEFARAWERVPRPRPWPAVPGAALLGALAGAGTLAAGAPVVVWLFLVVACADGFAQVVGQLAGRRRLAPRLSPGKTLEGALGGIGAALLGSVALRGTAGLGVAAALRWGAAVALAGLAGDLAASWVKRRAGLKDYSRALPGQGGFLDRFDSLIGALALLAIAWPRGG